MMTTGLHRLSVSLISVFSLAALLSGCSMQVFEEKDGAPDAHVDLSKIPNATPRKVKRSRYGNPSSYVVFGKRYHVMQSSAGFTERGIASWYGNKFHGRKTSSGEQYDMFAMTAAHKSLPLPTYVEVRNLENDRTIIVKVNDRGPFHQNRTIDLSYVAAAKLGITAKGTGLVEIRSVGPGNQSPEPTRAQKTILAENQTPAAAHRQAPGDDQAWHKKPVIYLQAGAFGNKDNALRMQSRLRATLQSPVRITELNTPTGIIYRVQAGPVTEVSAADKISLQLDKLGIANLKTIIE